jgi:hypothetical protein
MAASHAMAVACSAGYLTSREAVDDLVGDAGD